MSTILSISFISVLNIERDQYNHFIVISRATFKGRTVDRQYERHPSHWQRLQMEKLLANDHDNQWVGTHLCFSHEMTWGTEISMHIFTKVELDNGRIYSVNPMQIAKCIAIPKDYRY